MGHYGEQGAIAVTPEGGHFFGLSAFFDTVGADTAQPCRLQALFKAPYCIYSRIAKARRIAGAGSPSGD